MKAAKCRLITLLLSVLVLIIAMVGVYFYYVRSYDKNSGAILENPAYIAQVKGYNNYAENYVPLVMIKYVSYGEVDSNVDQTGGKYHLLTPLNFESEQSISSKHTPKAIINVVGDVIPHADLQVAASLNGGYQHMFANIEQQIKDGDINIANLETPVAPTFPYQGISLRFNASPVLLDALKSVGFNVLLTANNHAVDQSDQGYRETVSEIAKAHMISLGGWKNDKFDDKSGNIITVKGIKVGLLNYTLLSNRKPQDQKLVHYISDIGKANQEIQEAAAKLKKNGAEYVILMIHWGIQYHIYPKKDIYHLAQQLLSGNIDLIIGGHPHVIQPIEVYKKGDENKVVAYSLGNFISHQRGLAKYGLMAKITLIRNSTGKVVLSSFTPEFFKVHLSVASFRSSTNAMSYTYLTFKLMGISYLQFLDYQCLNKQAFDCLNKV